MPWIKAIHRLPKNSILVRDQVVIKWDNGDDRMLGRAKDCKEIMENGWLDVEWFEEPNEQPDQSILLDELEDKLMRTYFGPPEIAEMMDWIRQNFTLIRK